MARKPRLDVAGFHHIINRGVAKSNVFNSNDDKDKFLEIICKACRDYKVNIHDYCLMDNHYHLLVETTTNNLSLFMRQINSNYAIYFNKKNNRVGHLWQGRYKSFYIAEQSYLYELFRYIEHNPIEAKICKKIGEYNYTLLATILRDDLKIITCAKSSKLAKEINYKGVREHLELPLNEKELKELKNLQSKEIIKDGYKFKYKELKSLKEYLKDAKDKTQRDKAIMRALDDGYKQVEIAKYLELTPTAIAKIKKKYRNKV
jgi:REP element-mobilizing transposase RayT